MPSTKEMVMFQDSEIQQPQHELERNAYNAAFYELGFRWYWDHDIYEQQLRRWDSPTERIRHYLEDEQPHLLRAYDSGFLVAAIEAAQLRHVARAAAAGSAGPAYFDWAQMSGAELGT